jgi:hypothetical protein
MRQVCTVAAVLIACGSGLAVAPREAGAGPVPTASAPPATSALIEQAGYWKRRWRNGYYGPGVVIPDAEVDVDAGGDVDVEVDAPAVIVLPPPRPLSCGEYHYWNGERCVDARYNTPYLGPK